MPQPSLHSTAAGPRISRLALRPAAIVRCPRTSGPPPLPTAPSRPPTRALSSTTLQAPRPGRAPWPAARAPARGYKTVQEARSRYRIGPFSFVAVLLFLGTGAGMAVFFRYEKARMERRRIAEASKGVGKPKVGGPFELVDQDGRVWDSEVEMRGRFGLVYFGFTHCPDICPEELDKMADMIDLVEAKLPAAVPRNPSLVPVFITCDPARDTPPVLRPYLNEFHARLVGLTGGWEQIKAVCKLYRVYFSTPQGVQPGQDYLVDHSIYFYLMDPDGDFVEAIGRQHTAEEAATIISAHMSDWRGLMIKH